MRKGSRVKSSVKSTIKSAVKSTAKYRYSLFTMFLLFVPVSDSLACSCLFEGGFFAVAKKADLLVEAEVSSIGQVGSEVFFDIRIKEVYSRSKRAGDERADAIRVWTDNGAQCRRSIREFPIGSVWIFGLNKVKPLGSLIPEYEISVCGEYAVERRDETVSGVFSGKTMLPRQEMKYQEFKSKLQALIAGD